MRVIQGNVAALFVIRRGTKILENPATDSGLNGPELWYFPSSVPKLNFQDRLDLH
jgi:hypothetical protein